MKVYKSLSIAAAMIVAALVAMVWLAKRPGARTAAEIKGAIAVPETKVSPAATPATTQSNKAEINRSARKPEVNELSRPPVETVTIRANQVLKKVNGVSISGKDLLPFSSGGTDSDKTIPADLYEFLLNLAVERELIFQAARTRGVELTEEQKQQQEQVRQTLLHRDGEHAGQVVHLNEAGTLEEQIEFETRDAASRLLLNSLLAKTDAPSPYITEDQVKQYYQNHLPQFAPLPAADSVERERAWQKIDLDIRQTLAPTILAEYQEHVRQFLGQLRAEARIAD